MIAWGSILLLAGIGREGEGGGLVIAMKIEGVKGRQSWRQEREREWGREEKRREEKRREEKEKRREGRKGGERRQKSEIPQAKVNEYSVG